MDPGPFFVIRLTGFRYFAIPEGKQSLQKPLYCWLMIYKDVGMARPGNGAPKV